VQTDLENLFSRLCEGDRRSASRIMTLIENEGPGRKEALERLYRTESKALVVGVTGWPGVGKSSLINRIAGSFLDQGKKVGIIAIDPTSPLSGGGLLADRIRFREIEGTERLFVRSVASRGHHGGLSLYTRAFVKVMESMGSDVILLETVGVGQDQITVSLIADTTIVVVAPGLGDYLQAIKSGVLEVGDIFVVNKADRPDADRAVFDLEEAARMRGAEGWCPPVVKTIAAEKTGADVLMGEITRHASYCADAKSVRDRKLRAAKHEIRDAVESRLFEHFFGRDDLSGDSVNRLAREICARKIDPYMIADMMLSEKGIG
jgi:LAO/AO transport system kinase